MLLLILRHVDALHGVFVVEEVIGQCLGYLRFSNAGRSGENERDNRPARILQAGARLRRMA